LSFLCPSFVVCVPRLLDTIYGRHAPVLLTMARGAYELRQKYKGNSDFYDLEGRHSPFCWDTGRKYSNTHLVWE
jgi:hypothetical protein